MAQIIPVKTDMFPDIYDALLRHHDGTITRENWERIVNYPLAAADTDRGYALVEDGKVVGFHGTLLAERLVQRKSVRFCNLHTWIVKESHRGHSLALLRPILRQKGHTLTDMTPSGGVYKLLRRLGFVDLDRRIMFLLPTPRTDRGVSGSVDLVCDANDIAKYLSPTEITLLKDHSNSPCRHVVFFDGRQHCLLIYTAVRCHWISYCYIHYCGNSKLFEQHQGQIRAWLMKESRCWFVAIDSRFARDMTLRYTKSFPIRTRKLFRSDDLAPHQIDNLYTELTMNGLSGLPNFSGAVKRRLLVLLNNLRPCSLPNASMRGCRRRS